MSNKRGNSEGNIRKRSNGSWEARYTAGFDEEGKQIQRSVYAKTRTEVAAKLNLVLEKLTTGKYIDPSHMPLSELLEKWLESKKNKIKANTFDNYEQHIYLHIIPGIGNIKLKDLKSKDIQSFYDKKFGNGRCDNKGGLSTASITKLHTVLHGALESAVNKRIIAYNPVKGVEIPKGLVKERRVLTLSEQEAFINALEGDRLRLAFLLEISTGMRLGEVLALTWDDINLNAKYLIVRKTLAIVKDRNSSKKRNILIPQEPKTEKGKRLIPIPDSLISLFEEHQIRQEDEKTEFSDLYQDNKIVFCTQVGTYVHPRNYMRSFYRIIEKACIPKANVHSLRHTFATRMLEMGENAKVVQELLGHKNITTTLNTYTHVLEDTKRSAIGKINALISAGDKDKTENKPSVSQTE